MSRGLNIFVNIGAKLLPSLNSTASGVERRLGQMNRKLRVDMAKTKAEYRELAGAMKPIAAMAAAGGLSMGLKGIFGNGNDYGHELAMLRIAGRTTDEVSRAIAQANRTMANIPTSTLTDNLKIIRETTGAYGSFGHALENLDFNSKLGFMMTNAWGIDPTEVSHILAASIQGLEVRGTAMDPRKYQREMGELFKAMTFFAGKEGGFDASQFKAFTQTGNIPIKGYGERFMTRILPSLITELGGGDIVGTQASAFRNQIMGRVPLGGKKLTDEWVRLGLVPAPGTGGNLSRTGWTAGTVKGHDLAMADPFKWIENVLLPAMAKVGINTADPNAVLLQVSKMFGRETAMRFVATMADPRQRARLHKDEGMIGKALPLNGAFELMLGQDPTAIMAKMQTSWTRLLTNLGKAVGPELIGMMNGLSWAMNGLANVFEAHPWLAKATTGLLAFGAAAASLRVFGIGLKFLFSPLKSVWALLFKVGPRQIGLVGWLMRGMARLGPIMWRGLSALGPIALRAAIAIGPWLLRGVTLAFGLLSNPIGWAILAASAIALVWIYRKEIAAAWPKLVNWFKTEGWPQIRDAVYAVDWSSLGSEIASSFWNGWKSYHPLGIVTSAFIDRAYAPTVGADGKPVKGGDPAARPTLSGMRAKGGPVLGGNSYLVGEEGPEIFSPGKSGTIIPNSELVRRRNARSGGVTVGAVNIYGANDPQSTRRIVREELNRMANGQSSNLSD